MKKSIVAVVIASVISVSCLGGCASMQRSVKNVGSDLSGGTDKLVVVYDNNGDEIQRWEGKIDVETDDSGKMSFDLDGKRVIINGGTTIVTEK